MEIKDEFEANGEDYERQVSLAIASGELPDIMRITSKDVLDELVENNLVEDLTDVYEEYASDYIKKMYESYDGRCFEAVTYDGRLMALPGTNNDTAPCDVFIRQDWLDKLNIKADQDGDGCLTVDELGEIAKAFVENDPGNTGNPVGLAFAPYLTSGDYDGSGYTMMAIASAYGAFLGSWLMDESGKVYNGLTTEGMKKALAKVAQWYEEGIVDSQFGTRTWDDITALLTNGQTGITFGPWHLPDWLLNNVRSMDEETEFSVFTICDKEGKVNVIHNNAVNGYLVVRKGYSNPEVLMKMANLFMDEIENNEKLEEEAPEVNEYIKSVDDTAKPFQIGITASTSLTDNYSEIMSYVNGDTTIDGVKNAASKVIAESVKRYNEIRVKFFKKTVQTIVYLPHFLSWVVLAAVVVNMVNLDGIVNQFLEFVGSGKINFLGSNTWFRPLVIVTDVWKEFGYNSIVYLAAITAIDPGLHEAAAMDELVETGMAYYITGNASYYLAYGSDEFK